MAQMTEQIKAPEEIQLNDEEIANLSDAEFKTLVMRMLTELVEYGCKMEEEVKAMQSEITKIYREPTVKGRKPGLKSTIWNTKKEKACNQNSRKKKEFKNMRTGLGTSGTTLNVPTSESQGCQKEKRKSKKWKTYFKK